METAYPISAQRVADIPVRQRPRELFERFGADHVSEEVLLAILLRSGVRGVNVVELAHRLMTEYKTLTALSQASVEELARVRGMGKVKAQVVRAALALGRRLAAEAAPDRPCIRNPEDAANAVRPQAVNRETEAFWVLLLDSRNRLRRPPIEISSGLLNASLAHPREVFKEAIRSLSAAIVLVHNHPSGDPTPSAEDVRITRQLVETGQIVDIPVLDHVILGRANPSTDMKGFFSLRESGLVDFKEKTA